MSQVIYYRTMCPHSLQTNRAERFLIEMFRHPQHSGSPNSECGKVVPLISASNPTAFYVISRSPAVARLSIRKQLVAAAGEARARSRRDIEFWKRWELCHRDRKSTRLNSSHV